MYLIFTDEEQKYIEKEPFKWRVKKDCPRDLKHTIRRKLEALNSQEGSAYYSGKEGTERWK